MKRIALPYQTRSPLPVREQQQFEQAVKDFKSLDFSELERTYSFLKPEGESRFDYWEEDITKLVHTTKSEEYGGYPQSVLYNLLNAGQNYQYIKGSPEKLKWMGYYNDALQRAVESLEILKTKTIPDIIETIDYIVGTYFYAEGWDISRPEIIPRESDQDGLDNFFNRKNWNPAPALKELEDFIEVSSRIEKYVAVEQAWYKYMLKARTEEREKPHEKIFPEGIEPIEIMWHVTTAYSAVMREGFKTKDQLRDEGKKPGGLGGGQSDSISFTASYEHAEGILDGILEMVEMALDPPSASTIVKDFQEKGVSEKGLQEALDGYQSSWGKIKDFEAIMDFNNARYLYERILMEAQSEGVSYSPMFWGPEQEIYANIDPKEVQIVEAVVNTTDDETTYHWAEEEWRIPVKNILSLGPVGSQEKVLENLKAQKAASATLIYKNALYIKAARPNLPPLWIYSETKQQLDSYLKDSDYINQVVHYPNAEFAANLEAHTKEPLPIQEEGEWTKDIYSKVENYFGRHKREVWMAVVNQWMETLEDEADPWLEIDPEMEKEMELDYYKSIGIDPLSDDTVFVYHVTSKKAADKIFQEGFKIPEKGQFVAQGTRRGVSVSTNPLASYRILEGVSQINRFDTFEDVLDFYDDLGLTQWYEKKGRPDLIQKTVENIIERFGDTSYAAKRLFYTLGTDAYSAGLIPPKDFLWFDLVGKLIGEKIVVILADYQGSQEVKLFPPDAVEAELLVKNPNLLKPLLILDPQDLMEMAETYPTEYQFLSQPAEMEKDPELKSWYNEYAKIYG